MASASSAHNGEKTKNNVRRTMTVAGDGVTEQTLSQQQEIITQQHQDRQLLSPEEAVPLLASRSFEYCLDEDLTPEECKAYIESEIGAAGEHEVGANVPVKIHSPRSPKVFKDTYWMMEVPVDLYGMMACDLNDGHANYPFLWVAESSERQVEDVDCRGSRAGECCMAIRSQGQNDQTNGYDVNGNCLACFVHQEPLVPVWNPESGETEYQEYALGNIAFGQCEQVKLTAEQVSEQDELFIQRNMAAALQALDTLALGDPTCGEEFEDLLEVLYDAAARIHPLSELVGQLSCQFCYGNNDLEFDDPVFADLVSQIKALLQQQDDLPSSTEQSKSIIIYTSQEGDIVRVGHTGVGNGSETPTTAADEVNEETPTMAADEGVPTTEENGSETPTTAADEVNEEAPTMAADEGVPTTEENGSETPTTAADEVNEEAPTMAADEGVPTTEENGSETPTIAADEVNEEAPTMAADEGVPTIRGGGRGFAGRGQGVGKGRPAANVDVQTTRGFPAFGGRGVEKETPAANEKAADKDVVTPRGFGGRGFKGKGGSRY
jgi:hypothetical protein